MFILATLLFWQGTSYAQKTLLTVKGVQFTIMKNTDVLGHPRAPTVDAHLLPDADFLPGLERLHQGRQIHESDAFPVHIQFGPGSNAMEI